MERNRLYIALGVLAVLIVATVLAFRKPDEASDRPQDPWHRVERAQVTKIVIQRPGSDVPIELEKRDNHWFMNRPSAGPADESAVNDALELLSEMHVASIAAREPSSHADMQVDAANAIHVTAFRGATQALDVLVGKNLDGGTAIRVPSGPIVYRVDRSVRYLLTKEPREWRDRAITHLEREHVRSVEWRNARGTFHFDRAGDTWTAAATNPPIERLDTARVNQNVVNLLDLRATDFAAAGANTAISDASPRVTLTVDNGAPITLKSGAAAGESEIYVQREGGEIVYTVGRSHSAEIDMDPAALQTPIAVDAGPARDGSVNAGAAAAAANAAEQPGMPGMPGGMQMPGDGGIPPEIMEQIRRQLQQRGMGAGGAPPGH